MVFTGSICSTNTVRVSGQQQDHASRRHPSKQQHQQWKRGRKWLRQGSLFWQTKGNLSW